MRIREGQPRDIPALVAIDRQAYGDYGADEHYFEEKFSNYPQGILVVEKNGSPTGFIVFELMEPNEIPTDFCDLEVKSPLDTRWMHIIAFTTETNFLDVETDSQLVFAAEKLARTAGCQTYCVPLPKDHLFASHNVFDFWEKCGYSRAGEIKWKAGPDERLECYFYKKPAA